MSLGDALYQGLLPYLSPHAHLQARLVCRQWRACFSQHVACATLPAAFWSAPREQQAADLELLAAAFPNLQQLVVLLDKAHAPGYLAPSQQRTDVYVHQVTDDDDDDDDRNLDGDAAARPSAAAAAAAAAAAGSSAAHPAGDGGAPDAGHGLQDTARRRRRRRGAAGASDAGGAPGAPGRQAATPAAASGSGQEAAAAGEKRKRKPSSTTTQAYNALWLPPWSQPPRKKHGAQAPPAAAAAAAASSSGGTKRQRGARAKQPPPQQPQEQEQCLPPPPPQQQQQQPEASTTAAGCDQPCRGHTSPTADHITSPPPPAPAAAAAACSGAGSAAAAPAADGGRPADAAAAAAAAAAPSVGAVEARAAAPPPPASDAAAGQEDAAAPAPCAAGAPASFRPLSALPRLAALTLRGALPAVSWQLVVPALQACSTVERVQLQQAYLPPPEQLAQLLSGWPRLRVLHLLVSLRSPRLQAAHIEALSSSVPGLQELHLQVGFTDGGSGAQLEPLMALTQLTCLRLSYTGIMPDQRLALRPANALSALTRLQELASHGTARPLLPLPSMSACVALAITGQRQRLTAPGVQQLCACTQLQRLVMDARKRVPALAAAHLPQLAQLTGLTALTCGLTAGSVRASDTGQMLLLLTSLRGLQQLSLSADHRMRLTAATVERLSGAWQRLNQLSLVNVDPVDGLGCFSGFGRLSAFNLSPAAPQESGADHLSGLSEALSGLPQLSDLRLNSRSLKARHVQEISDACARSHALARLSLQLNTSTSTAATLQAIARLRSLKALQLHRLWAAFLGKAATQAALAELQQLWQLGLFVDGSAWILDLEALPRQFAFLGALRGLQQLDLWLGESIVSRTPRRAKVAAVLRQLAPSGCRVAWLAQPPDPAELCCGGGGGGGSGGC